MPDTLIRVDLDRPPEEQEQRPHNRWHPEVPPVATVEPGIPFRVECFDATGGQILNNDSASDVAEIELGPLHYLSGPIRVEGAEPGDLLQVDILHMAPLVGAEWGYSIVCPQRAGLGLLADLFPEARKAIWDLDGIYATSRHIEDVRFPGMPQPATIGCAPSHELLEEWNRRERALEATLPEGEILARFLPDPEGAFLGEAADPDALSGEAARTWAAREHGGNMHVKDLTIGSRGFFPVYVEGANLSLGNLQFSQGDGKVTGFGGVKMAGAIDLRVEVVKDGQRTHGISTPVFRSSPLRPVQEGYQIFQGISVDRDGTQHYLDVFSAYRRACLAVVDHLERFGYTRDQAYVLLSAVPLEGRTSCLLEHPNVCVTLALPRSIFSFDIGPCAEVHEPASRGALARPE